MTILVTGSAGMIGSHLSKRLLKDGHIVIGIDKKPIEFDNNYSHFLIDLGDINSLENLLKEKKVDRIIHLAALAHATGGRKYPKSLYEHLNVECSKNIFQIASKYDIPVLFISTVDVFGFQKGEVDPSTICKPVTIYGKTKYKAEQILKQSGCRYTIFRFSPVYTQHIKRDIQKRIYLKYPNLAYQIGKNTEYEVLDVDNAVNEMSVWCKQKVNNDLRIIKDEKLLQTRNYIIEEKKEGRAKYVVRIPKWIALTGYYIIRITGKNRFTFLISKAIYPLRSK